MKALLRLSSDITTKASATRLRFTKRVVHNLGVAFAAHGVHADIERTFSRIYLDYTDPRVIDVARRVFGIHSISPCTEIPATGMDELVAAAAELALPRMEGKTFAVRARVRGDYVPFSGQVVNETLGAVLAPHGKVKLKNPAVTIRLEVRDGRAFFYEDSIPSEAGVPLGVGGRAVMLLSGGFDSAVAAYLMMRRGILLDFVACRLGGEPHARAVQAIANHMAQHWAPGMSSRLWLVPFEEPVEHLKNKVDGRYRQLVLKRMMYRVAERVAFRRRCDGIVTGESIGQVSSQTMRNLRALMGEEAFPILRPLLTYDKEEIITRARHVGSYELSVGVPEYCDLDAGKPATGAGRGPLSKQEQRLDFDPEALLATAVQVDLPAELGDESDIVVQAMPDGATVLDLRTPPARRKEPIADAVAVDPLDVLEDPGSLKGDGPFVVVCDEGARSAWFARRLRDLGLAAFSLAREAHPPT